MLVEGQVAGATRGGLVRLESTILLLVILSPVLVRDQSAIGERVVPSRVAATAAAPSIRADYIYENLGQLPNSEVRFYTMSGDVLMGFADGAVLVRVMQRPRGLAGNSPGNFNPSGPSPESASFEGVLLTFGFDGANDVAPVGQNPLPHPTSFFLGKDPTKWRSNVRAFREIVYEGLYDGVDLVYRATAEGIKYDVVLAPGGDLGRVALKVEGALGLVLDAVGNLHARTAAGDITDSSPIAHQGSDQVQCSFALRSLFSYGFACEGVDPSRELVVDPLVYATYLGGGEDDLGRGIVVAPSGDSYVTGVTFSPDFPVAPGAFDTTIGGWRGAFVTKLSPLGALLYSTFLGGAGLDNGYSITVDSAGNAYVTGRTGSTDFPVTLGAFDTTYNGGTDAFLTKLSPTGASLVYSTYLGGSGFDVGESIAIDASGSAHVVGWTDSQDFPVTPSAHSSSNGGWYDAFVGKLNPAGTLLLYATYLGGGYDDRASSLAIDAAGAAYVAGYTRSSDFPATPGALDTTRNDFASDDFIAKLDSTGSSLLYATYLGGSDWESEYPSLAIDAAGAA